MTATTSETFNTSTTPLPLTRNLIGGVTGGLAGGLVFGAMMHSMGMMPMIAKMAGGDTVAMGWVMHLAISAFIGLTLGVILSRTRFGMAATIASGTAYGALWWVLGPLLLMPAKLGMPLFMINDMTLNSLMGHLLFGVIAGAVFAAIRRTR